jgi:hypothetical protein
MSGLRKNKYHKSGISGSKLPGDYHIYEVMRIITEMFMSTYSIIGKINTSGHVLEILTFAQKVW